MRTALIRAVHLEKSGEALFEIWYDGVLIGCIYGLDGQAGVRIISKHPIQHYDLPSQLSHFVLIDPANLT